ncbi:MAG: 3-keto-5-aminohexanoate cleavage protein [Thermoplasmata archaeon]|nr:MAG: 3-keto-5-aminohexanoate cleavage protein [Thermoplasmata archaeon]
MREKLIVTVTVANAWIFPEAKNYPTTPEDIAETVYRCYQEGASIAHVHLPKGKEKETVDLIREKCDIIVQAGMSSDPIEERKAVFDANPDMISVILNHHDEYFHEIQVNRLHPREELERYCKICREKKIKPEFEVWHYGSIWNLNYLINKNLLDKPYFLTMFLGWPGGTWSPPTADELLHRIKYIPDDCVCSVSVMGKEQKAILPLAIGLGLHVRVGTEDYPYLKEGVLAKDNSELVRNIVRIARETGREIADPSEARKIVGLRR